MHTAGWPLLFATLAVGPPQLSETPLRALGVETGVLVGAMAQVGPLVIEPRYDATLGHEFSELTVENAMRWGAVQPAPDQWDFGGADVLVKFAREHDMNVKGELLGHRHLPAWVEPLEAETLRVAVRDHLRTMVGHYRGRVAAWVVVKEAAADDGAGLRRTIFLERLGESYIADVFHAAREADPDALLFYHDHGIADAGPKSDFVLDLLKRLRADGVPVHGVGIELSVDARTPLSVEQLGAAIDRFAALGLRVDVTRLQISLAGVEGDARSRLAWQARRYRDVVAACISRPAVRAVTFQGVSDSYAAGPPEAEPLLFDKYFFPKPAYDAVAQTLRGAAGP